MASQSFVNAEQTDVLRVERSDAGWQVVVANDHAPATGDALVLAPNVPGLKAIVAASPDLADDAWRKQIDGLSLTLPFAVWRIWLDREVAADRVAFVGTAGLGAIDNISVYERFEGESRRHAMRKGGSVVEIHAYAVPEGETEESIRRVFLDRLHELYPETRDAGIREERFLLRQDCPAFPPGGYDAQPTVETPWPTLSLAGDFAKLPFPSALMERATASGMMAANHILSPWGVRGEEVYSLPPRGILARWF